MASSICCRRHLGSPISAKNAASASAFSPKRGLRLGSVLIWVILALFTISGLWSVGVGRWAWLIRTGIAEQYSLASAMKYFGIDKPIRPEHTSLLLNVGNLRLAKDHRLIGGDTFNARRHTARPDCGFIINHFCWVINGLVAKFGVQRQYNHLDVFPSCNGLSAPEVLKLDRNIVFRPTLCWVQIGVTADRVFVTEGQPFLNHNQASAVFPNIWRFRLNSKIGQLLSGFIGLPHLTPLHSRVNRISDTSYSYDDRSQGGPESGIASNTRYSILKGILVFALGGVCVAVSLFVFVTAIGCQDSIRLRYVFWLLVGSVVFFVVGYILIAHGIYLWSGLTQ